VALCRRGNLARTAHRDLPPEVRVRLPADRFSDDDVVTFYAHLTKRDTRVAPGSWFGEHDRVFRLGFGHLAASDFSTALDRLTGAIPGNR
jgi:DNA-binding transcriptional MocR family regulator